jgi:hypothetical protein
MRWVRRLIEKNVCFSPDANPSRTRVRGRENLAEKQESALLQQSTTEE